MIRINHFQYRASHWWHRLLLSFFALLLFLAFFFFAIFALIAVGILGLAWSVHLWWRHRSRRNSVQQDIFVKEYRVLRDNSEALPKDEADGRH